MRDLKNSRVAVVGSGPAGLMAADVLSRAGVCVSLFEKRKATGRKLLIAGSSGLNITYDAPVEEFAQNYWGGTPLGESAQRMSLLLKSFGQKEWCNWIEALGIPTFLGTSRRYFIEGMRASKLVKVWVEQLKDRGVEFCMNSEVLDFKVDPRILLKTSQGGESYFDQICFALGGGSYEPDEVPLRWVELFKSKGIGFRSFESSNCGFQVNWPSAFLEEAEGQAIKNLILTSSRGSRSGDCVVTRYGIEGTPIYFAGEKGTVFLDLKPDLSSEQLLRKLLSVKENLSPLRRAKKVLNLNQATLALIFHMGGAESRGSVEDFVRLLKRFPLELLEPQPLAEAISSKGGVVWSELDPDFMLKKFPGIYLAGEMIDWDAPTGGFLIQGSVSQGHFVANRILNKLMSIE